MKNTLIILIAFGFLATFSGDSNGQVIQRNDKRQQSQKHRVKPVAKAGEVTKRKTKGVKKNNIQVNRYQKKANSSGKVIWKERSKIETKQDKPIRKIYPAKLKRRN